MRAAENAGVGMPRRTAEALTSRHGTRALAISLAKVSSASRPASFGSAVSAARTRSRMPARMTHPARTVLAFSLLSFAVDSGGAAARAHRMPATPALAFPQQPEPRLGGADWRPHFIDYLYLADACRSHGKGLRPAVSHRAGAELHPGPDTGHVHEMTQAPVQRAW
ncbi:hypothetical protein SNARM312S_04842 [Streptomyces narbonensis]